MKLLFDQNLSYRLPAALANLFPDASHVRDCGLSRATDEEIWTFAVEKEYAIVSKDGDFHQRSFLLGFPPKIIWLRLGNCSTQTVIEVMRKQSEAVTEFLRDLDKSLLALSIRR